MDMLKQTNGTWVFDTNYPPGVVRLYDQFKAMNKAGNKDVESLKNVLRAILDEHPNHIEARGSLAELTGDFGLYADLAAIGSGAFPVEFLPSVDIVDPSQEAMLFYLTGLLQLGNQAYMQDQIEMAAHYFSTACSLDPFDTVGASNMLFTSLINIHSLIRARDLAVVRGFTSGDPHWLTRVVVAHLYMNDSVQAKNVWASIVASNPSVKTAFQRWTENKDYVLSDPRKAVQLINDIVADLAAGEGKKLGADELSSHPLHLLMTSVGPLILQEERCSSFFAK